MINIRKQTKWYNDKADAINSEMVKLGFFRIPKANLIFDTKRMITSLKRVLKSTGNNWLVMDKKDKLDFLINTPGGNI